MSTGTVKPAHLLPALLAVALAAGALVGGDLYARRLEDRYADALAPTQYPQKQQGTAAQAADFRQSDLLPIYGSSELNIREPYHGSQLFAQYPTGFTIAPVGKAGTTCLPILEDLASVGPDLKGKKVVISLSAPWFFGHMQAADSYAGNYSSLHGFDTIFSTQLSDAVKRGVAARMLDYPETLKKDPVLKLAVAELTSPSPFSRLLYDLVWPLGKLQAGVVRLQDHWDNVQYIQKQQKLTAGMPHKPARLNWQTLLSQAKEQQVADANNNPFGFQNDRWPTIQKQLPKTKAARDHDAQWKQGMLQSKEWTDLELLLQGLKEMGAQPLLLSMPIQGPYYDYTGVTAAARQAYYDKLEQVAATYQTPVLDFRNHDEDKYFLIDTGAHLSREGWIYYDQALAQFYHGNLP